MLGHCSSAALLSVHWQCGSSFFSALAMRGRGVLQFETLKSVYHMNGRRSQRPHNAHAEIDLAKCDDERG